MRKLTRRASDGEIRHVARSTLRRPWLNKSGVKRTAQGAAHRLVLCAVLALAAQSASAEAHQNVDVSVRAGPLFTWGDLNFWQRAFSYRLHLTAAIEARGDVAWRLSPKLSLGLMGHYVWAEADFIPTTLLQINLDSYHQGGVWMAGTALIAEFHPRERARIDPFVAARLGWEFMTAPGASDHSHGPTVGADIGVDLRPWERLPFTIGLVLDTWLVFFSSTKTAVFPSSRPDGTVMGLSWGSQFSHTGCLAVQLRVGYGF